jgi:hypothetical protein
MQITVFEVENESVNYELFRLNTFQTNYYQHMLKTD